MENPDDYGTERYEIILPNMTANNLVIGTMYIDLRSTMKVKNTNTGHCCDLTFTERGYFSKEKCKLAGHTFHSDTPKQKVSKVYGNWDSKIYV